MHYYQHNIGDYRRDTAHLSITEHGIYRQLLDTYYLDEKPLPLDLAKLMRSHCIRTADEERALKAVLADFFEETTEGWRHKRCDKVIEKYYAKSDKARASAHARWAKSVGDAIAYDLHADALEKDANALPTQSEGNANQEPITNKESIKDSGVSTIVGAPKAEPTAPRARRLDPAWQPSAEQIAFCQQARPDLDPQQVAAGFRDYWIAKPGRDGCKLDWNATWRNWVRNQRAGPKRATTVSDANQAAVDEFLRRDGGMFDEFIEINPEPIRRIK